MRLDLPIDLPVCTSAAHVAGGNHTVIQPYAKSHGTRQHRASSAVAQIQADGSGPQVPDGSSIAASVREMGEPCSNGTHGGVFSELLHSRVGVVTALAAC